MARKHVPSEPERRNIPEYQLPAKGIEWRISYPGLELGGCAIA